MKLESALVTALRKNRADLEADSETDLVETQRKKLREILGQSWGKTW